MRSTWFCGWALLLIGCGAGPVLIKGRVVDHRGAPVAKAVVQTQPPTDSALTNARGFFILQRRLTDGGDAAPIESGTYALLATKTSYEPIKMTVVVDRGVVQTDDLVLQPRTLDIKDAAPTVTHEPRLRSR